jgi:hypothetical protein
LPERKTVADGSYAASGFWRTIAAVLLLAQEAGDEGTGFLRPLDVAALYEPAHPRKTRKRWVGHA